MEKKIYIIGYGSLINLESLGKTLGREVKKEEIKTANLKGFKRYFNLKHRIFSEKLQKETDCVFLNLEKSEGNFVNVIIIEVNTTELYLLHKREFLYNLQEINPEDLNLEGLNKENSIIFCFISENSLYKQNMFCKDCFVLENYMKIVEDGCKNIGEEFLSDYYKTTSEFTLNILGGSYKII